MASSSAESFNRALWPAASKEPALPRKSALPSKTDTAVIGGGITGCAAALALSKLGAAVTLIESRAIGWGASGRNGGQVIPGLKLDPSELKARYGEARGNALTSAAGEAASTVFDLIVRHVIQCDPQRGGWIQAAHSPQALGRVYKRAREWLALGAPVELLSREQVAAKTGTNEYHGGWIDRRAGTVNPCAYVRGLARAAASLGTAIVQNTKVKGLKRDGGLWQVSTSDGSLLAKTVIVATDAYSDGLIPGLAQTLLPVQSAMIATDALSDALRERIAPDGVCASETRRLAFYFRLSPCGRLVFGGRGAVGDAEQPVFTSALISAMRRLFPEVRDVPIAYRWSGQISLTFDGLPHLHEPEPGLFSGLGYNGRGVAMATVMGQWLANLASGGEKPPLPLTPISPIAWHALRRPAIALGIRWAWFRDRMGAAA
jgi:sarcosine oxidase